MKDSSQHPVPESIQPTAETVSVDRRQWIKRSATLGAVLPFLLTLAPEDARAQGSGS